MTPLTCFKTYDIRGKLGAELNPDIAYRIGRAYAQALQAKRVVVGCDTRLTSESLKHALAKGLIDSGVHVIDLGLTGTEEVYFASFYLDVDGGIEITASHNPIDYNGMKFIGKGGIPINQESGLNKIKQLAEGNNFETSVSKGSFEKISILEAYTKHILSYIKLHELKPLKLVVNAGNGAAGHVIDAIEAAFKIHHVPIQFIKIQHEPDGNFPNGIPNPLLPENRKATEEAVIAHGADMGIAWDGDFDRCFLFDESGRFIEGYYIVGLLAESFVRKNPGEKIIHDSRLTWNTIDIVKNAGGAPIESKTGHVFIKESMRIENAIYGGEMSAHHYFRDFAYCDSGMIPWLLIAELISITSKPLSELVNERMSFYPCSGEINYTVNNPLSVIETIREHFSTISENGTPIISTIDGISIEFNDWRFNLRPSNTEPLLRLNLEVRNDKEKILPYVKHIEMLIQEASC